MVAQALGRQKMDRPQELFRGGAGARNIGWAEIENLHLPPVIQQDTGGVEAAMDRAVGVCIVQGTGQLA